MGTRASDGILKVGASRSVITPSIGTQLYGYAQDRLCTSVNDDLTATAIVFEYKEVRAVLISVSLCMLSNAVSDELRRFIGDLIAVPSENVMLSATHTHSGPVTGDTPGWGSPDNEYIDKILIPGVLEAVSDAAGSVGPALMGISTINSNVGINRREMKPEGGIVLGQNPWGIYDPVMTVISFRRAGEKSGNNHLAPIVNLVHYGAHCTAAGASPEVTRDWPGPMIDRLEKESGAITAFINGAEGDIAPRLSNRRSSGGNDISYVFELGAKAAHDAIDAYSMIKEYRSVTLEIITGDLTIPYKPLPSLETVNYELDIIGEPDNTWGRNYRKYVKYKKIKEILLSDEPYKEHFIQRQTLVALGPILFIPFPFEIFSEISLRLRVYSPYQHTLCLSNTNGSCSYLPTLREMNIGGYEVRMAKTESEYEFVDDADNMIIRENLRLISEMNINIF